MASQEENPHKDNPEDHIAAARDAVLAEFEAKRINLGNVDSESANQGVIMKLEDSINKIGAAWTAARESLLKGVVSETELLKLQAEHKEKLDAAVELMKSYIQSIAERHGGWLDAAAMAEITSSVNSNVALYLHLIVNGNPQLFKVMQVIMGGTAEGKSHSEEIAKTLPVLAGMATRSMDKGDKGIMPCIWVLAGFLPRPQRIEFGKLYAQGKTTQQVEEFLRYGNLRGVFRADEMQEVMIDHSKNPDFKFSDEKELIETWSRANDLNKKIATLTEGTYGSQNDAGRMINFKNILLTTVQAAACATVGGNLLFGIWKGGALKSPRNLVLAITNPVVLGAGAVVKVAGMARGNERVDKALQSSETTAINERKEALRILDREQDGNVQWDNWEAFFATNGKGQRTFGGAKVFADFILDSKKRTNSNDLPEGEMSTSKFMEYLEKQAKSKSPSSTDVDYNSLLEQFKQISPLTILPFAKAFDTLKIGGVTAGRMFEDAMKEVSQL